MQKLFAFSQTGAPASQEALALAASSIYRITFIVARGAAF